MKALVIIFLLAFNVTAQAEVAAKSNCAATAESIAKQMFLGNSSADSRDITTTVANGFDDNSDLVFQAEVAEFSFTGHSYIVQTAKYKAVAKGSEQACEILSVTKLAN